MLFRSQRRLLPLPKRSIAGVAYSIDRKFLVVDTQFLQAHGVRFRYLEPFEQPWKAVADAVYIKRRDFHQSATEVSPFVRGLRPCKGYTFKNS